jgi:hypothetical protein
MGNHISNGNYLIDLQKNYSLLIQGARRPERRQNLEGMGSFQMERTQWAVRESKSHVGERLM